MEKTARNEEHLPGRGREELLTLRLYCLTWSGKVKPVRLCVIIKKSLYQVSFASGCARRKLRFPTPQHSNHPIRAMLCSLEMITIE
jgi:hypothetical protein